MTELSDNVTRDISGNDNSAFVEGATIKERESFLLNAIERNQPVFSNEKYAVYLVSSMNASQTTSLNTTGFLSFEELTISGNLTIKTT